MTGKPPVLFVDDEPAVRMAGAQALELAGHEVVCCESAEDALERLSADWPGPVVSDVRLPGIDGMALLGLLRKIDPELPVVMITGHGEVSMAVEAMRIGAYDFIEKPFPAARLVETVGRAADRRALVMENRALRRQLEEAVADASGLVGRTPAMERLRRTIAAVADADADVLIWGETGTGKELVARSLHLSSRRAGGNFVALNCGAIPDTMIESELFGHEQGAFTGAIKRRTGRIAHAGQGTLFLDEIESMSQSLQVKLLRVLQERVVEPLGSNDSVPVDVRVVAATKEDLRKLADQGRFREDLYYRLNVVVLRLPPLRERCEDIPLLFQHFVADAARRFGRQPPAPGADLLHRLMVQRWPGNVRELRAAAERYVLGLADEPIPPDAPLTLAEQVDRFEKSVIEYALATAKGDLKATLHALGLPRKTFYDKLKRHGLTRSAYED